MAANDAIGNTPHAPENPIVIPPVLPLGERLKALGVTGSFVAVTAALVLSVILTPIYQASLVLKEEGWKLKERRWELDEAELKRKNQNLQETIDQLTSEIKRLSANIDALGLGEGLRSLPGVGEREPQVIDKSANPGRR